MLNTRISKKKGRYMSALVELLEQLDLPQGFSESRLQGVRFFKSLEHLPPCPLIYEPGIVIIAQGKKVGYLGDQVFHYDANNYLVLSVAIPFYCETFASQEKPLLGIYINVDILQLIELVSQLQQPQLRNDDKTSLPQGIDPATLDDDMADATVRLLKCLQSDLETRVLGSGLKREVLFRALCGTQAPMLHTLVRHNGNIARISRALKTIRSDYASKLNIEQLAGQVDMSVSAFHRAFKEVTSDSPMQYLKKIRLYKARDFIIRSKIKAYVAADKVGYESVSQFSREFKRYFGKSPGEFMKELR